jgi:acetyl esterase/lipase
MRTRLGAIAIVGTAAVALAAVGVSIPAHAAVTVISNIAYAPAQPAGSLGHLLDLYLPSDGTPPRPLIIWSSGSAWMSDNGKSGANTIANVFNPRGYAVAGVSVRSSSQALFPAQVHDIKAAIRWLRAHASQYQLDPNRFAIMGNSSGGWVANMAGVTGGVAQLEGSVGTTGLSSRVQASVPFFGPTDFLQMNAQRPGGMGLDHNSPTSPESRLVGCAIQTCPAIVTQANPITYVDQSDPPMMLLHGQADTLVPHGQSAILYTAIRNVCGDAQFFSVPGAGHSTSDVMSSSRFGSQTVRTARNCQETVSVGTPNPSWDTIDSFLRRALNIGGSSPGPTVSPTPSQTGSGGCRVAYTIGLWGGGSNGFTANLTLTNTGPVPLTWTLTFTLPSGQALTPPGWGATYTRTGSSVSAAGLDWNRTLQPGQGTQFGFNGTHSGNTSEPSAFSVNGTGCTVG